MTITNEEIKKEAEEPLTHKCPACRGDGKETCNNPDHGFIAAFGSAGNGDIGRLGCPCCGHHPEYKVAKYINGKREYLPCYECGGVGLVTENECERILDEWQIDEPVEDYVQ